RDLVPQRQHHEGGGHGHRRSARDQPFRGRGGGSGAVAGDHGGHSRGARRDERGAGARALARGHGPSRAADEGPSTSFTRPHSLRRRLPTPQSSLLVASYLDPSRRPV